MIHLSDNELSIVKNILATYIPDEEVWAFGSRVHGRNLKPFSDLDVVIISKENLAVTIYGDLTEAFSESSLPFTVDLVEWSRINESFKKIIMQEYEIIQSKGKA